MRMIANILYPDSGTIRVFGQERSGTRSADRTKMIGYLPEERGLYRKMRVRALLEFHGELRGGRNVAAEVNTWLERLGLAQRADDKVETLSKGMSQKVQFIATVIPEPKLLILDEPFSGLDPVSADSIRGAILEMRKRGCTVILSTHDMGVAESLCDSIFMIFRGKKVLDGTLASIQSSYGSDTIRVEVEGGSSAAGNPLGELPGIERINDMGHVQELRMAAGVRSSASPPRAHRPHAHHLVFRGQTFSSRHLCPHRRPATGGGAQLNRTLLIAKRDYLQTVRSKAYLVGLIVLPLLFGGGFLARFPLPTGATPRTSVLRLSITPASPRQP